MGKNKCQGHVAGTNHIIKYYGNYLPLVAFGPTDYSLNKAINWTKSAYTLLSEKFTFYDKLVVMYLYVLFNAKQGIRTSILKINVPKFITRRK